MTKHGRNSNAIPIYTQRERIKDNKESFYGLQKQRLTKHSIKNFDCCSITLQPCVDPVVSLDGHIFDREAIISCFLKQKEDFKNQLKEYENQIRNVGQKRKGIEISDNNIKINKFLENETSLIHKSIPTINNTDATSIIRHDNPKFLPSFWIPSLTPSVESNDTTPTKPIDRGTYCPVTKKPLKLKDLLSIKFTKTLQDKSIKNNESEYICALSGDQLTNSNKCVVLKTSGDVIREECIETVIRKSGMICPFTNKKLTDDDFIHLKRGGTGFSGSGSELMSQTSRPSMLA